MYLSIESKFWVKKSFINAFLLFVNEKTSTFIAFRCVLQVLMPNAVTRNSVIIVYIGIVNIDEKNTLVCL